MVVTNADKKANTKAYQNYKAGNKAYKAADHMGEEKKAAKDYDGDGKVESGKDEYFGSKDKAIKKAMGKKIKEGMSNWRHDLKEIPDYDQIPETSKDRNKKIEEKKVKNTVKINPNMEEGYGDKKKKKKHDCASKVKHEQFGVGNCISEAHDLDENGNVAHYDVEFGKYTLRNVPVEDLEILEGTMHEHAIREGSYEATKTKEVMGALKKRDLKKDVKKKIAADIVKRKGDTSKSDDRYAYEEVVHEKVATGPRLGEPREKGATHANAGEGQKIQKRTKKYMDKKGMKGAPGLDAMKARTAEHKAKRGVKEELVGEGDTYAKQLARFEANRRKRQKQTQTYERPNYIPKDQDHSDEYGSSKGQKVKKENYQAMRNPEKEEKKDKRSAREKRMADPKKGINSPAFKEFMRQQGMG